MKRFTMCDVLDMYDTYIGVPDWYASEQYTDRAERFWRRLSGGDDTIVMRGTLKWLLTLIARDADVMGRFGPHDCTDELPYREEE